MSNNHDHITPYSESNSTKKEQVSEMFDNVAGGYDALNRVITFGMDVKWRKRIVNIVSTKEPKTILDIATGTGDMAILFAESSNAKITGLDISKGMLDVAHTKVTKKNLGNQISLQVGDAENLPFEDSSYDVVSVTYGIRNFENLKKGLTEIRRVLTNTGMLVILETSVPDKFPMRQGYLFYTGYILPLIGRIFSKDKRAYSYLSESAMAFPYGERLKVILQEVGFGNVDVKPQVQGKSTIYVASR